MFTHLHGHTEYSLLDGLSRIQPMLRQCQALGMDSIAITDHGGMYGAIEFYTEALKIGVKPIIGCEVYLAPEERHSRKSIDRSPFHLTLLAHNITGYQNLIQLVTKAHLEGFYYKPRIDKDLIAHHNEGLIALSGCLNGEIPRLVTENRLEEAYKSAQWFREILGQNFYLELQRHPALPELETVNSKLIEFNRTLGIPLVATNDFHYISREHASLQDILICIHTNTTVNDEKRLKLHGDSFHLKSPQDMAALFSDIPEAITNTQRIAEMCEVKLNFDQIHLPGYKTPNDQNPDEYLSELCLSGLLRRLPGAPTRYEERIRYELEVIRQTRFANYFLVVWDIISFARTNNILFGVRGSAAASLVLFCLGVTDVDPLEYNLVFERFLNVERKEMPDIDMDFQDDRRDEVIQHVVHKYGQDHVAQIITFGTMGPRAAIRDVGRALAMPYPEVDRVAKMIPPGVHSLEQAKSVVPELLHLHTTDLSMTKLIDTACEMEGMVRHISTHAAGVVISNEPLTHYVPLQKPVRNGTNWNYMTQFSMAPIAQLGLLKMDFLGLANLTVLDQVMKLINQTQGLTLGLQEIPLDNQSTFDLLSSGETADVFQLEGAGMRRYIRELKPTSLAEIAAMIALYRPGPMEHIETYIKGKHGQVEIHYPHPSLKGILEETYGVIVYQDQVLNIARHFAGYTLGEADIVRKAMGKKIPEIMEAERDQFYARAQTQGYSQAEAASIFDLIEPFAGYAFNKAHAVSYALIAYWTAYFKANFPTEYMTSVLNIRSGNMDKIPGVIAECTRLGIPVLPPDINLSQVGFVIESVSEKCSAIRFGLGAIKNVGDAAIEPIISNRETQGCFISIEDLCNRVELRSLNRRTLESLIKSGATDSLNQNRSTLLAGVDPIINLANRQSRLRDSGQTTMFGLFDEMAGGPIPSLDLQPSPPPSLQEIITWEKELLGVPISHNPLKDIADSVDRKTTVISTQEIDPEADSVRIMLVGLLSTVRIGVTKQGKPFAIGNLTLTDGMIEIVAWPNVYEGNKQWLLEGQILEIVGRSRKRNDQISIVCDEIKPYGLVSQMPDPVPDSKVQLPGPQTNGEGPSHGKTSRTEPLRLTIEETEDPQKDQQQLKNILRTLLEHPGDDVVLLDLYSGNQLVTMKAPITTNMCQSLSEDLQVFLRPESIHLSSGQIP